MIILKNSPLGAFFFLIVISVLSSAAFAQDIVDHGMGLKVFFERGMSPVSKDVQEVNENTPLTDEWNISGYLRLVSKSDEPDVSGHKRWNGFNAPFPVNPQAFSKIDIILRKTWKAPGDKTFSKEIACFSMNDKVSLRKIGPEELDGNQDTRDYWFSLDVPSVQINFPMPLECMNPELFLYELQVLVKGEKAVWNVAGTDYSVSDFEKVVSRRLFLVRDTVVPEIEIVQSFPEKGTTGDPLDPAESVLQVLDTNPNQEMAEIYVTFSNQPGKKFFYMIDDTNAKRDYNESEETSYISAPFTRKLSADDPQEAVLMPENGSELEYTIVAKPSFGPPVTESGIVENTDNDPPDITFSIGTSSSDPAASGISVRVYGGVYDPLSGSADVNIEYQYKGTNPVKRVFKEDIQGPWEIDLDAEFAGMKTIPAVPEDQRLYFRASAMDNVDMEVEAVLSAPGFASTSSGVVNLRQSGKKAISISAEDKSGNKRTIRFTLTVREGSFRTETLGSD